MSAGSTLTLEFSDARLTRRLSKRNATSAKVGLHPASARHPVIPARQTVQCQTSPWASTKRVLVHGKVNPWVPLLEWLSTTGTRQAERPGAIRPGGNSARGLSRPCEASVFLRILVSLLVCRFSSCVVLNYIYIYIKTPQRGSRANSPEVQNHCLDIEDLEWGPHTYFQ